MEKFVINGGNVLGGTITVSGAKNSALKVLCASILTPEKVRLFNMPIDIEDVKVQIDMLKSIGVNVIIKNRIVVIDSSSISKSTVFMDKDKGVRTSLLMLGSMLGRFGWAKVPFPIGDNIGERKFDLHIYALNQLGANVRVTDDGFIEAECNELKGAEIDFPILTMGGTENAIIAACLAKGRTTIRNAYVTPEVLDLVKFLNSMGANINVRGSRLVEIDGVEELYGTNHKIIPDRLEALTFAIIGAVTKGFLKIKEFPTEFLEVPLIYLREAGINIYNGKDCLIVDGRGGSFDSTEIVAGSYPGIISDMQPLFAAFATQASGNSAIIDIRYPNRFAYIEGLQKMGADIHQEGNIAMVKGPNNLKGANVTATDLRAGAALLISGLCAMGQTEIENIYQIDRGYERIEQKLKCLGADIKRVTA